MDTFLTQKQQIVVRGLLEDSGEILITVDQRYAPSYLEYYNLPGGVVPFGREPAEVLQDIFFEQTHVRVKVDAPLRTINRILDRGSSQILEIIYRVEKQEIQSVASQKSQCLWVQIDERGYFLSSCISETLSDFRKEK